MRIYKSIMYKILYKIWKIIKINIHNITDFNFRDSCLYYVPNQKDIKYMTFEI